jgi:hypothetical protein
LSRPNTASALSAGDRWNKAHVLQPFFMMQLILLALFGHIRQGSGENYR